MRLNESISGTVTATLAGGVPEDVQNGIIQLVVGIVTGLLIKLFNRIKYGTKKEK
jgi:hypothetical protein